MHFPTHTTSFKGPVVDQWLEWKIAQTPNASAVQDRLDYRKLYRWVALPPELSHSTSSTDPTFPFLPALPIHAILFLNTGETIAHKRKMVRKREQTSNRQMAIRAHAIRT